jgi:DNA-3-methyladenine glycosylase
LDRIPRSFYEATAPVVARKVLGKVLVRKVSGERLSGRIVETEAYRGSKDPASHAFRGLTRRNAVMFGEGGHAYVYLSYGLNHCLNLTCEPKGRAAAVLVRALEPLEGIDSMMAIRQVSDVYQLASGPGKLTQALRIDGKFNGEDLVTSRRLFIEEGDVVRGVSSGPRVGITRGAEYSWRFFVRGNKFVSKGRPTSPQHTSHNYDS